MRVKKGSLNYWLLFALEKSVDGTLKLNDFIYNSYKYSQGPNIAPEFKKSALSRALKRLREAGYIENNINQGQVILKLSKIGRDYLGVEEKWDGKYRIIIWDIPEKKRRIRDLFRRRLKEWGFKNWQRSVWVSKRNVVGKLRKLVRELGIDDWVAVIESEDPSLSNIIFNDRGT